MKQMLNSLRLGILAAATLSLFGLNGLAANTYAVQMSHQDMPGQICSVSCVSGQSTTLAKAVIDNREDQDDIPVPPITTPYFVQFLNTAYDQPATPKDLITLSSYQPPDINRLNSNFRF